MTRSARENAGESHPVGGSESLRMRDSRAALLTTPGHFLVRGTSWEVTGLQMTYASFSMRSSA